MDKATAQKAMPDSSELPPDPAPRRLAEASSNDAPGAAAQGPKAGPTQSVAGAPRAAKPNGAGGAPAAGTTFRRPDDAPTQPVPPRAPQTPAPATAPTGAQPPQQPAAPTPQAPVPPPAQTTNSQAPTGRPQAPGPGPAASSPAKPAPARAAPAQATQAQPTQAQPAPKPAQPAAPTRPAAPQATAPQTAAPQATAPKPTPPQKPASPAAAASQPGPKAPRPAAARPQAAKTPPNVTPPADESVTQPAARRTPPAPPPALASDKRSRAVAKPGEEWKVTPSPDMIDDPLLDCLVILTAYFERPHSGDALTAGLPLVGDRLTPDLFVRAAARAGISARMVKRKITEIADLSLPCVLLLKGGKACILIRHHEDGTAAVIMPEAGRGATNLPITELAELHIGYAIFARPEYQFDARSEATEITRPKSWFWGTLMKFWRIYALVGVGTIFINAFAIASPLFVMNVYDRVVPNQAEATLWVLVAGVATVYGFEFILRNLRTYFVDTAGKSADVLLASNIFQQILGIRMSARPASAGAFANQLREFETLRDFFTSATLVTLVDLPFLFLFIAVIWYIGGPVAYVPLVTVPLAIIAGVLLQLPLTRIIQSTARESAQKHALLVESIVGLETIKSIGAEGRTQRNWERFVGQTAKSQTKARALSSLAMFITTFLTQMTTVGVVVLGVYQIIDKQMTIGALIACTILTGRAMAPLSQVAGILTRFNQSVVSLKTLDSVMKMPVERPQGKVFVHRPNLRGEIEFKDVSFAYPEAEIPALDNVSFKIEAGERIGIIGKIGSGKSTVERLVLGLYEPQQGSVRIDGTDIQQLDPADIRRNIGYVPQDMFLFYGSVRENIAMGASHIDDNAILRAAKISGVESFISKHPKGFDLQVGERGEQLSGGQRQSVVIARALVREPRIMVLDEPTSAMDKGSEDWFLSRLREYLPGKTLIVVTQRVSLLSLVDRLLVMDGAKLVADGPRDKVLESLARGQIKGSAAG